MRGGMHRVWAHALELAVPKVGAQIQKHKLTKPCTE
jgi:hypothetical protein